MVPTIAEFFIMAPTFNLLVEMVALYFALSGFAALLMVPLSLAPPNELLSVRSVTACCALPFRVPLKAMFSGKAIVGGIVLGGTSDNISERLVEKFRMLRLADTLLGFGNPYTVPETSILVF